MNFLFNQSSTGLVIHVFILIMLKTKLPLMPMGGLANGSVHVRPHWRERKNFGSNVCRIASKHLTQPTKSIQSFRTLGKFDPLSTQNRHSAGGRGGPGIILFIGILIFLWVRRPFKFSKTYHEPFAEKSNPRREKERNKQTKNVNSGHLAMSAQWRSA